MKIAYFTHSLASCWNHGNAHFLRGVLRDLKRRGHEVRVHETRNAWSLRNLLADHGEAGLAAYRAAYPDLVATMLPEGADLAEVLDGAELVVVHEWNDPALVQAIGHARAHGGRFTLLFHDTHHRMVSDPAAIGAFDLTAYDGVLAFGEALAEVYRRRGWGRRVFVWHEAADITLFHPPALESERAGLVWIGNWGDGERAAEIGDFLLVPARKAGLPLDIHGVRYPAEARDLLEHNGVRYRGWLPNADVPTVFAAHLATVHVPRRYYVKALPGIPTIRVFEALACGIPLVSAPWSDEEDLFRPGQDFLVAEDGNAMARHMRDVRADADMRADLVRSGRETILARHTCAHRVDELLTILRAFQTSCMEVSP